ncbi:MAG: T9SS type A sorting domain-containing protein, partial [Rhizobacter sp.]|nr:T9SS type A sorting domain-containing protein [Chlorobiales bacterium]
TVLMSNIRVQGNSIGLQKNGSSPITSGSQQYGVRFNLSVGTLSNAIVGDNGLGGRNTIADNTADGLDLNGAGVGSVLIGGNSIYNNAQKGIRLSGGANAGIIAPVVASVSTTSITGTITGTGAANKIIRVYTGKDDEGRKLLGQIQVPNGSSNWTLNGSFSLSDSITATYTDIDRTSAFSAALAAPASLPTWTLSNSGIGAGNLNGVAATLSRIITVGNTGKIYLSIDGALTWTLVGNGITANNLNDIVIPSNANSSGKGTGAAGTQGFGSAVAVGVGGTILRSNDGGSSWASVPSGSTNELNSVATAPDFTDSTLAKGTGTAGTQGFGSAVAVGVGGTILRSADGGDTWSTTTVGSAELNGVSVNGGFELRATAAKGTSTSGTFGVNGFGSAVAVGVGGTILRSDNGGDTWSTTTVGSSDLNGVSFTPNFEPLAAGSRGKGTSTSGTFGVNGFGSAVAVGVGGTILRSSDGANWLNVSSNVAGGAVGNDLLSVQMVSESEGYISGTSGLVLKTIDGGVNWTPQSIPTSSDLNDIAVLADGSGFTAGDNQTLLVTNNSGDQTLPVSLLAFTASSSVINGFGAANLAWSTESETDNAGFSVMRRENTLAGALEGFKLVANYLSILTLQGGGSTTSQKDYRYTDDGVSIGSEYFYRLRSHDYSGTVHDYPIIATVRIEAAGSPKTYKYELRQNYPNPFNPQTTIAYTLQNAGQVQLELFNTLGQKVKVIDSGFRSAGEYRVTLGSDNLSSGMYFYRLVAASERGMIVQTKKLLIVK